MAVKETELLPTRENPAPVELFESSSRVEIFRALMAYKPVVGLSPDGFPMKVLSVEGDKLARKVRGEDEFYDNGKLRVNHYIEGRLPHLGIVGVSSVSGVYETKVLRIPDINHLHQQDK